MPTSHRFFRAAQGCVQRYLPAMGLSVSVAFAQGDPIQEIPVGMDGQVLWVDDVVPALERLLASERLMTLWDSEELRDVLVGVDVPRSNQLAGMLDLVEPHIPTGVWMGASAEGVDSVFHAGRALLHVVAGMSATDGDIVEAQAAELEPILLSIKTPRVYVRWDARTARTAEMYFDAAMDLFDGVSESFEQTLEDDTLSIRGTLYSLLEDAAALPALRRAAPDEETADRWLEIMRRKPFVMALTQSGASLELRLSDGSAPAAVPALGRGVLWPIEDKQPQPTMYCRWGNSGAALGELVDALAVFLDEGDPETQPLEVLLIAEQGYETFAELSSEGEAAVWTQDELRFEGLEDWTDLAEYAELVTDSPVHRLIPESAVGFILDGSFTLDGVMSGALVELDTVLDKIDDRAIQAYEFEFSDWIDHVRYESMGPLEELLHGEESVVFELGAAMIVGRGGPVGKVQAGEASWDAVDQRLPGLAWIGRPEDEASGTQFAKRLGECMHQLLDGAGDPEMEVKPLVLRDGMEPVSAVVVSMDGNGYLPTLPDASGGDMVLHSFQMEGWQVLSSSLALSADIADRIAKGEAAAPIPEFGAWLRRYPGAVEWAAVSGSQAKQLVQELVALSSEIQRGDADDVLSQLSMPRDQVLVGLNYSQFLAMALGSFEAFSMREVVDDVWGLTRIVVR